MAEDPIRFQKAKTRRKGGLVLFALSALIPFLGLRDDPPSTMLLFYSLFVAAWFLRKPLGRLFHLLPGGDPVRLLVGFLVSGSLCETFAWLDNYVKAAETPALFHPQLFWDLYLGIGFYGGWALVWIILGRHFRFGVGQAFWVTGILGIAFEQVGKIFWMMLQFLAVNPAFSLVLGIFVLATHGSIAGLALTLAGPVGKDKQMPFWWMNPLAAVLLVLGAVVGTWLVIGISYFFGGIPPRESIVEHPFW